MNYRTPNPLLTHTQKKKNTSTLKQAHTVFQNNPSYTHVQEYEQNHRLFSVPGSLSNRPQRIQSHTPAQTQPQQQLLGPQTATRSQSPITTQSETVCNTPARYKHANEGGHGVNAGRRVAGGGREERVRTAGRAERVKV